MIARCLTPQTPVPWGFGACQTIDVDRCEFRGVSPLFSPSVSLVSVAVCLLARGGGARRAWPAFRAAVRPAFPALCGPSPSRLWHWPTALARPQSRANLVPSRGGLIGNGQLRPPRQRIRRRTSGRRESKRLFSHGIPSQAPSALAPANPPRLPQHSLRAASAQG